MVICKNCGVQLDDGILMCPLCGYDSRDNEALTVTADHQRSKDDSDLKLNHPQKKMVWEIISIILLSGILTTLSVDMILNKGISWSLYPVSVCLVIFSYVSMFAFWRKGTFLQLAGSFILSSILLVVFDRFTGNIRWSFKLAIPLLFAATVIVSVLIAIVQNAKYKGINLIAYSFVGILFLCASIDGIFSFYSTGAINFKWSVIVSGCIIPVVILLLFIHFRLKKGRDLERTFHI